MNDLQHLREVLTEAYPREELSLDALARVVAALDGLPPAALDGGWTFKGFTVWAQKIEAEAKEQALENERLRTLLNLARDDVAARDRLLQDIGDYAHRESTGPAVPDALWEVRSMAYGPGA